MSRSCLNTQITHTVQFCFTCTRYSGGMVALCTLCFRLDTPGWSGWTAEQYSARYNAHEGGSYREQYKDERPRTAQAH